MSSFQQELLDNPQALIQADRGGLLRALAGAGAQVRRSIDTVGEFGVDRLRGSTPPRAVLVAPDAAAPYLSSLLAALASAEAPVIDWRDPALPRWAGPADALLVVSADGRHPRLAELVAQADRRGMVIAVAAPVRSPVAAAAARHPVADVTHLASVPPRAVWWALATPALQALDALGLTSTAHLLTSVADSLDGVAEVDRPDSSAYTGPAKLLAAELAESVPVIAGIGRAAMVAARRFAGAVQLIGGSTAMAAALPDDVARIGSLLEFATTEADFFADRVSDPGVRPRLVLIGDDDRYGEPQDTQWDGLGDDAGRRAGSALAGLAASRGIGSSRILVPDAPPLVRFAAAAATGDFAATYLALARGIDPSAPRLGELPH
ncbi:MAG TPA: SIS domain-containing protein [Jatrophihabitans sp.]|uniref:SIS domain-containing protein n=1 Tax=Jatrophihabitans sp. TaxID=1932789 RepID=UPI002EDF4774